MIRTASRRPVDRSSGDTVDPPRHPRPVAGRDGLSVYLRDHKAHRPSIPAMVSKALDVAAGQTLQLPGQAATAMLITTQARKLLDLDREIKEPGQAHHQQIPHSQPGGDYREPSRHGADHRS